MNEIGLEGGHRPFDRRVGQPDRDLFVAGDAEAAGPDHPDPLIGVRTWSGGDDQQLIPTGQQPVGDVANRVRHTIDLRQEGLGDHHYAHTSEVPDPA